MANGGDKKPANEVGGAAPDSQADFGITPESATAVADAAAASAASAEQHAAALAKAKPLISAVATNAEKIAAAYQEAVAAQQQNLSTAEQEAQVKQSTLDAVIKETEQAQILANVRSQAAAAAKAESGDEWELLTRAEKREVTLRKELESHEQIRSALAENIAKNDTILNSTSRMAAEVKNRGLSEEQIRANLQAQNTEYSNAQSALDQVVKALTQQISKWSKSNQEVNRFSGMTKDLLSRFTGITDQSQGMIASLFKAKDATGGWGQAMQGVQKGMRETLTTTNIVMQAFEKAQEAALFLAKNEWDVAKALNNAEKSFMRTTGAGERYRNTVHDITQANKDIIPSYDKAAQMATELYNNMYKFSQLGPELQSQMTRFATVMERVGVQSGTTVEMLNTMTKTLRMTEQDAATATAGLTGFSQQLGVNTNNALKQFSQLSKDYASFGGPKLVQTFRRMQVIMKSSGAEMTTLTGIAK